MGTTLSAEIIHGTEDNLMSTHFYVRAIHRTVSLINGIRGDAWAAYCDTPVRVGDEWLVRSERVSDAPRETAERAAEDMGAEVRRFLERAGDSARLIADRSILAE